MKLCVFSFVTLFRGALTLAMLFVGFALTGRRCGTRLLLRGRAAILVSVLSVCCRRLWYFLAFLYVSANASVMSQRYESKGDIDEALSLLFNGSKIMLSHGYPNEGSTLALKFISLLKKYSQSPCDHVVESTLPFSLILESCPHPCLRSTFGIECWL